MASRATSLRNDAVTNDPLLPARAEEVRGPQLTEVTSAEQNQLGNELMIREHPLHQCRFINCWN